MSLKSREKSVQRQPERQDNIFTKQKAAAAIAKRWTKDYLYAALFFAALTVLLAVLVKDSPEDMKTFWIAMPILAAFGSASAPAAPLLKRCSGSTKRVLPSSDGIFCRKMPYSFHSPDIIFNFSKRQNSGLP